MTLVVRCPFCACGLSRALARGCTASDDVGLQSLREFVNGAVLWSDVDWRDAAASVLEGRLIFKPIYQRVYVLPVIAVIVVSTQSP